MRIRTGHKPEDWTENVPTAAHGGRGAIWMADRAHHMAQGTDALPIMGGGSVVGRSQAELHREAVAKSRNKGKAA